jgi:biopolymer transport protein ExbD
MKEPSFVVVCFALWGCSPAGAPPSDTVEVSLPSSLASTPNASAANDRKPAASPAAVEACVAAIDSVGAFDPTPGDSFKRLARACHGLYSEAGCSRAWTLAAEDETGPADRLRILTEGCRAAYCPSVGVGLAACSEARWSAASTEERAQAWFELNEAIRLRELSPEQLQRVKSAEAKVRLRRVEAVEVDLQPPPAAPSVSVELDAAGMVSAAGQKRPLAELSQLLGPARNAELVVTVEKATPMPIVVKFMDAAKAAGFSKVTMSVR